MENLSSSKSVSNRVRATSVSRQPHNGTMSTQSPASPRAASIHSPLIKNTFPNRPHLRRPSASAPGLSTSSDRSPPAGISSTPLSPRPENAIIHQVLETHHIQRHHNEATGNPTINNYEILGEIGAGVHGKVKKAKDSETGTIVAIKIVNRVTKKKLGNYDPNEQENKIKREIAIMKKCHHPNIVNLIEVIDNFNSQKVYLVLEYVERGEIKWRDKYNQPVLTVDQVRPMIRDVVLGLEYLHFQGIIHRDIKPGNLLIANNGTVKISDFGVSHLAKMDEAGNLLPENDLDLAKTAGSPAFFAPELCQVDCDKPRPAITKAIDVWALGITFFCLLFGREPFPGVHGEMELYDKICHTPIEVPPEFEDKIDANTKELLQRLLTKDPNDRIKLYQVRRHPFIIKGIPDPRRWAAETDLSQTSQPLQVTAQEVESAVTSFRNIVRRTLAQVKMTARRSMSYLRPRHTTGRLVSGGSSPITVYTLPNSPTTNRKDQESNSPKSDTTANRPKPQHAFFSAGVKSMDVVTPPSPPVEAEVPNGHHVNSHSQLPDSEPLKSIPRQPAPPLTPPNMFGRTDPHLNDDYSNLYYSESDYDEEDEDDDEDMLEMKGSKPR